MKPKRIVVLSCLHAGNIWGLTPPGWQCEPVKDGDTKEGVFRFTHLSRLKEIQSTFWNWFEARIRELGPIDICIGNGDLIDGRGERQGGQDVLLSTEDQVTCATATLRKVKARQYYLTLGTPYHTGQMHDHEREIAGALDAPIDDRLQLDVNGRIFDFKHEPSGRSGIPHGRHTSIARDNLWNELRAARGKEQRSDVTVRSHVHYHAHAGGDGWLAMTTPCLQLTSLYGKRRCHDDIDVGFLVFDVSAKGEISWQARILRTGLPQPTMLKA